MHTQLPFFAIVKVSGDDRHDFLHNQFSNDINHLEKNYACYATYNTPKGRVIANLIAFNTGDDILLILAADVAEKVVKRLKMFVLRAKVQLELLPDWGVAATLPDNAPTVLPKEPRSASCRKRSRRNPVATRRQPERCAQSVFACTRCGNRTSVERA